MNRNACWASALAVLAAVVAPTAGLSQTYPSQDVNFICGFAAGSGADVMVRYFADKMRPLMNRTIIVQNKPGAVGNIATEFVARSKPDGHTIYVTGANSVAANMHLFRKPSVDVAKAFQIVATINNATMMLAVPAGGPVKSIAELTRVLKAKGDKASYAYANATARVLGAMYKEKADVQAVEIAYRTGADFLNELYSGKLDFAVPDNIQAMAQANAGRMLLLGVGADKRMQAAADIPTMTELGYPMDIRSWWAALVPSATPRPIVEQLNRWFNEVVARDETKKFLQSVASDPWVSTPEEAQAYLVRQIDDWREWVRIAKIEPQG
ncbi:MAG: Bug family tripartite tricarboxylate transporter substrate binding protein [Xanthobacteraceae bacterium]